MDSHGILLGFFWVLLKFLRVLWDSYGILGILVDSLKLY